MIWSVTMRQKEVDTYTASIYVGIKRRSTGRLIPASVVENICHDYCDEVGLCVTVTPTKFIYVGGWGEPGVIVGLINYPRFPSTPGEIRNKAIGLAERISVVAHQLKISIVFPDKTVMIENETEEKSAGVGE